MRTPLLALCSAALLTLTAAARGAGGVTLYAAADEPTVRAVVSAFEKAVGVRVTVVMQDAKEPIAARIEREKASPAGDVLWVRDHVEASRLADAGLLQPHESPAVSAIPPAFTDPKRRWHGFGLRQRVLVWHKDFPPDLARGREGSTPVIVEQMRRLWHPIFGDGGVVMERPWNGGGSRAQTTALYLCWEREMSDMWIGQMRRQSFRLVASERAALKSVALRDAFVALADSDSVWIAREEHPDLMMGPIKFDRFNIQDEPVKAFGPLLLPSAAGIIAGAPNKADAAKLLDFLLSPAAEAILAGTRGRCVPMHPEVAAAQPDQKQDLATAADASAIARSAEDAMRFFTETLPN